MYIFYNVGQYNWTILSKNDITTCFVLYYFTELCMIHLVPIEPKKQKMLRI